MNARDDWINRLPLISTRQRFGGKNSRQWTVKLAMASAIKEDKQGTVAFRQYVLVTFHL